MSFPAELGAELADSDSDPDPLPPALALELAEEEEEEEGTLFWKSSTTSATAQ